MIVWALGLGLAAGAQHLTFPWNEIEVVTVGYYNYLMEATGIDKDMDSVMLLNRMVDLNGLAYEGDTYTLALRCHVSDSTAIYGVALGLQHSYDYDNSSTYNWVLRETYSPETRPRPARSTPPAEGSIQASIIVPVQTSGSVLYRKARTAAFHNPYTSLKFFDTRSWLPGNIDESGYLRNRTNYYEKMIEFYFDTPVVVKDTFYIGITCRQNRNFYYRIGSIEGWDLNSSPMTMVMGVGDRWIVLEGEQRLFNYPEMTRIGGYVHNEMNHGWPLLFPIREPFDYGQDPMPTCYQMVRDFHFLRLRLGYPVLTWDSLSLQPEYVLQYVRADLPWDSAKTIAGVHRPYTVIDEFDTTVYYKARMRTGCFHSCPVHDTVIPGRWSEEILFYTGRNAPVPAGLSNIRHGEEAFALSPNPADGMVTLTAAANRHCAEIVVRDAAGREVLKQELPAGTDAARLDLSACPKGVYFVTFTTSDASETQRLLLY